jgi:hypothetical protein
MQEFTSLRIKKPTKKMLDEIGKKGETYDQIIKRMAEKCQR